MQVTGSAAIATIIQPQLNWPTPTPSQPPEPLGETPPAPGAVGWSVDQAQQLGSNDNSLGPIAGSSPANIWAVGDYLPDAANSNQDATLTFAEHYDGTAWTVVRTPNTGVNFNSFYGLAAKDGYAWAVGEYLNGAYQDRALIEVWNPQTQSWSIADNPQPGTGSNIPSGLTSIAGHLWLAGMYDDGNQEMPLIQNC